MFCLLEMSRLVCVDTHTAPGSVPFADSVVISASLDFNLQVTLVQVSATVVVKQLV